MKRNIKNHIATTTAVKPYAYNFTASSGGKGKSVPECVKPITKAQGRICDRCGTVVPGNYYFCPECGQAIGCVTAKNKIDNI